MTPIKAVNFRPRASDLSVRCPNDFHYAPDKLAPDLIQSMVLAKSHSEFVAETCKVIADIDCNLFSVGLLRRVSINEVKAASVTNSPTEWLRVYEDHDFLNNDPRIAHTRSSMLPFPWDITQFQGTRAERLFEACEGYGHLAGLAIPTRSNQGEVGMVFLTTPKRMKAKDFGQPHILGKGLMIAQYLQAAVYLSLQSAYSQTTGTELSRRELECLQLAARGHSAQEIAKYLRIASATTKFHILSARRKLCANNTVNAVAIALAKGFITL